jgi:hypothetical protein
MGGAVDAPPEPIVIVLPGVVMPTLNDVLRLHWAKRLAAVLAMAWYVRAARGRLGLPAAPIERARLVIVRASAGRAPDHDGLVGGCKSLIDVLLTFHPKVRPYGLGFIRDDDPDHLWLEVHAKRVARDAVGMTLTITTLGSDA